MLINLFDTNALIVNGDNKFFNNLWPVEDLEYLKEPLPKWDGISVFTDELCFHPVVDQVESAIKIAWAVESPVIKPHLYQPSLLKSIEHKFDYIYVCNKDLHRNEKYKQCYFGSCWLPAKDCGIKEKTKLLSIVASNKNFAPGHQLRHEIIRQKLHPELELWGSGYRWFENNSGEPFYDYRYVIVVENCQYPGYFTDKIVDCFAAGCIPIYWGAPDIGNLFNKDGFYTFNTIEDLKVILSQINEIDYENRREAINDNYLRFWEYASPDKWMLEKCYKKLLTE